MHFCMQDVPTKIDGFAKIGKNLLLDRSRSSSQAICQNYFVNFCDNVVAVVTFEPSRGKTNNVVSE